MSDITTRIGPYTVTVRAVGVVRDEGDLLVCRSERERWWYLPGGRVKTGESFAEAIEREMREELQCDFSVLRRVALVENFFRNAGQEHHEISLFFAIRLDSPRSRVPRRNGNEIRAWVSERDLSELDLKPDVARRLASGSDAGVQFMVQRGEGQDED